VKKTKKILLSAGKMDLFSCICLTRSRQEFHRNRTTCKALPYSLNPCSIPGVGKAKRDNQAQYENPNSVLKGAHAEIRTADTGSGMQMAHHVLVRESAAFT